MLFARIESGALLTGLSSPSWSWDLGDSLRGPRWWQKRSGGPRDVRPPCYWSWIPSDCTVDRMGLMLGEPPVLHVTGITVHSWNALKSPPECQEHLSGVNSWRTGSGPKEVSSKRSCDSILPQVLSLQAHHLTPTSDGQGSTSKSSFCTFSGGLCGHGTMMCM